MFDFVRTHSRLVLGLLMLVIFPSFVFFGVQGYTRFTDGSARDIVKLDGPGITQGELDAAHQRQIENYRAQMPGIDLKLLDAPEMKRETLDALVRERVTLRAADQLHLVVSDDRLARIFQTDPQFAAIRNPDGTVNRDLLAAQGMSSTMFEARLRQDLAMRQVLLGVGGSTLVNPAVVNAALDAALQRREVIVERFDTAAYAAQVQPTDADLEAFHKAHGDEFKAPEQAEIEYVMLDVDALTAGVAVPEADLRKYYDENLSRYTVAEERRASHILVKAEKGAPKADIDKARAKAQGLLDTLRKQPAQFAELAKTNSDDPGSAAQGGDLDFFGRGAMVKPFEDAVYAMKPGEISDLVQSDFGFHIIRLDGVRGGEKKTFDAVRPEIEAEVRKQLAQRKYVEAAEQFTNTVFEQPDSLQPVIDKLKLAKKTATVTRRPAAGATGPLASDKFLAAIFDAEAVRNKRNTPAVEVGSNQLASARVLVHTPERVRPLAEVRDQVLQKVRTQQAAALARKAGQARLATARQGLDVAGAPLVVSRVQPQGLPREVIVDVLKADMAKPPALLGIDLGEAGFAVAKVTRIVPRESSGDEAQRGKAIVAQALSNAESTAYYEALKTRFKVEYKPGAPAAAPAAPTGP